MNKKLLGALGLAILLSFSACLEGIFGPTEEEKDTTNNSFIGKWCLVTETVNGVKSTSSAIITMNSDGTGTHQSGQDNSSFTWNTEDSVLNVTTDSEHDFSATYQFGNNTVTLSYVEEGRTYVDLYAKYTGERNANLIGKWTGVRATVDGVDVVPAQTVTFGDDGMALAFYTDSTEIKSQAFAWTTSGNYLLNDQLAEDSDIWTGIEFTLNAPLMAVKEYYDDGKEYVSTFVKDSGEKDAGLNGTWNLTGLTVNSFPIPAQYIPQGAAFTLNATTGTGSLVLDATPIVYTWTTNSGYLLLYPGLASQIGIGQTYTISGNTLTFTIVFNAKTVQYLFGSFPLLANYAASSQYIAATFTFTK